MEFINTVINDMDLFENMNFTSIENYNNDKIVDKKNDNFLKTHKIARGRARSKQLATMTKEQKKKENEIRREKNRLAAKTCREKKKKYHEMLKCKVDLYEKQFKKQEKEISNLRRQVFTLKKLTRENYTEENSNFPF